MKTKTTPAKKNNVIYLLLKARYGELEQRVRCERCKTLKEAKAAIRERYKSHLDGYEGEEEAADGGNMIRIEKDGMSFSAVDSPNYTAESWVIEVVDLDETIE